MKANVEGKVQEPENKPVARVGEDSKENGSDTEFKVTVRKLKVPVRPRGVLAD
jgi:hypothetical protein